MKTRFLGNIEVSEIGMGCMGLSHGYGDIPSEEYSIEAIRKAHDFGCTFFDTIAKAHAVTPVSAVQNLYNMLERDCEKDVLPFCLEHGIGVVPFSYTFFT